MRALIAGPDALRDEGLAQLVRMVAPAFEVERAGKHELLERAAGGVAPELAIVAYPWVSLATLRALRLRHPDVAIVALTSEVDAGLQQRLLAERVAALVPGALPVELLEASLRIVLCGRISVQARSVRDGTCPRLRVRTDALSLTPRQFDVLALLARERPNDAIAAELGISLRTVKGHVAVVLRALHSNNRRDAGRVARRWLKRMAARAGTGPSQRTAGIG